MSKFTPKPWHVERTSVYDIVKDFEGRNICFISYERLPEESTDNAILIASSPDLLEALEFFISEANSKLDMTSAIKKAEAAIKKASGE